MPASTKTLEIAEGSILWFTSREWDTYYWTFTFAENQTDKGKAEKAFKKFRDLIKRRHGLELHFWEVQQRGAWHVHLLTNVYIDVNWLRPWMVNRGWGPQMRVERVKSKSEFIPGRGWVVDDRGIVKLRRYLKKYLTKSLSESGDKKKAFGGSALAKIGTTMFKWLPNVNPYSYLYYYGAQEIFTIFGEHPSWKNVDLCIKLGYEILNYKDVDPFFVPP